MMAPGTPYPGSSFGRSSAVENVQDKAGLTFRDEERIAGLESRLEALEQWRHRVSQTFNLLQH